MIIYITTTTRIIVTGKICFKKGLNITESVHLNKSNKIKFIQMIIQIEPAYIEPLIIQYQIPYHPYLWHNRCIFQLACS